MKSLIERMARDAIPVLDQQLPWVLKQGLVEIPLNHLFAEALQEGSLTSSRGVRCVWNWMTAAPG